MRERAAPPLDLLLSNLLGLRRRTICRRQFERYLGHALRVAFGVPGDPRPALPTPRAAPRVPCAAPRRSEGARRPGRGPEERPQGAPPGPRGRQREPS